MPIVHPSGRVYGKNERVHLKLPIGFAMADATTLFKLPADVTLALERLWWEITTQFAGGSSSTIGVSSDQTGYSTKGDLLGGASGDATATLAAGTKGGTIGAKFGSNGVVVLLPGALIRYDKITSAYTSGAGYVHVLATPLIV